MPTKLLIVSVAILSHHHYYCNKYARKNINNIKASYTTHVAIATIQLGVCIAIPTKHCLL